MMDNNLMDLVAADIPEAKPSSVGFLDVVGYTTKENAISNIYRYFLDQEQSPILHELFINSLLDLITYKYKNGSIEDNTDEEKAFDFEHYKVCREYPTKAGGRIDLVIRSRSSAIIIEAKVYHHLEDNNLQDYWDSIDCDDSQKAGIVLSIYPMERKTFQCRSFVSITHSEWLNRALENGLPSNLELNQIVYLRDFVNNMNNITENMELSEDAEFYFKHAKKINRAIVTKDAATKFLQLQLEAIAGRLGMEVRHDSGNNWWVRETSATVYYFVNMDKLLNGEQIVSVTLRVYSLALGHVPKLKEIITLEDEHVDDFQDSDWHINLVSITIPFTLQQLKNEFVETVASTITEDLEPLMEKVSVYLQEKDCYKHV